MDALNAPKIIIWLACPIWIVIGCFDQMLQKLLFNWPVQYGWLLDALNDSKKLLLDGPV